MPEIPKEFGRLDFMGEVKEELEAIKEKGKQQIRSEKRMVLENRSRELVADQERITKVVEVLYDAVYSYPDRATPEILMRFVQGRQEAFSEEVAEKFAAAIDGYRKKREIVQKFTAEHPDPHMMFERCFGVKPVGTVKVKQGPMTLCFQCFDDTDYVAAYTHGVTPESAEELKTKKIADAKKSGGVAFSAVKVPELAGCVIAERLGQNSEVKPVFHKREAKIEGRQKNTWQKFEYPKPSKIGRAEKITFEITSNLAHSKLPLHFEAHLSTDKSGNITGVRLFQGYIEVANFESLENPENFKISVPGKQYAAEEWVELRFSKDSFEIFDHSKSGVEFKTADYAGSERVIKDKQASKRIRRHEEQHQFNKLFEPRNNTFFDIPYSEFKRLDKYVKAHPEQNVTALVAKKFAQIYRLSYIDTRARDEILAYTRDGSDPSKTFTTLAGSSLYKYKDQEVTWEDGNKTSWEQFIQHNVAALTQKLLQTGYIAFTLKNATHAVEFDHRKPWEPSDAKIAEIEVANVLNRDYQKKLERWTRLVKNLKDAGFDNQDVVAFLGIVPITRWHSSVRRLLKSKGLRPIDKKISQELAWEEFDETELAS